VTSTDDEPKCDESCIDMFQERNHTCVEVDGSFNLTMKASIVGQEATDLGEVILPTVTEQGKDTFCGKCHLSDDELQELYSDSKKKIY